MILDILSLQMRVLRDLSLWDRKIGCATFT